VAATCWTSCGVGGAGKWKRGLLVLGSRVKTRSTQAACRWQWLLREPPNLCWRESAPVFDPRGPCALDVEALDDASEWLDDGTQEPGISGQQATHSKRHRQHPVPHRAVRQDFSDDAQRRGGHAPSAARRTYPAPFARVCDQHVLAAPCASKPRQAPSQKAATKRSSQLQFHVAWQRSLVAVARVAQERLGLALTTWCNAVFSGSVRAYLGHVQALFGHEAGKRAAHEAMAPPQRAPCCRGRASNQGVGTARQPAGRHPLFVRAPSNILSPTRASPMADTETAASLTAAVVSTRSPPRRASHPTTVAEAARSSAAPAASVVPVLGGGWLVSPLPPPEPDPRAPPSRPLRPYRRPSAAACRAAAPCRPE